MYQYRSRESEVDNRKDENEKNYRDYVVPMRFFLDVLVD
jgi:hypothetical protein